MLGSLFLLFGLILLSRGEQQSQPILCGDGVVGENEQCDDANTNNGDGCSDACQIEEGWECSLAGCCRSLPGDMGMTMTCYKGYWVASDDGSKKRQDDDDDTSGLSVDRDLFLCGRIVLNGDLTVVSGTVTIAGTLVVPDGISIIFPAADPYDHGQIYITESCGAPGIDLTNDGDLLMEDGSSLQIVDMEWTTDKLKEGGHEYNNFVIVQNDANTADATFVMEADRIPRGSHFFPLLSSGSATVNDDDEVFGGKDTELDGGCSNVEISQTLSGTNNGSYVTVTVNRKDLCESTIVGLAVGLPLGIAVLLLAVFVLTSGGGGASEDYVGL